MYHPMERRFDPLLILLSSILIERIDNDIQARKPLSLVPKDYEIVCERFDPRVCCEDFCFDLTLKWIIIERLQRVRLNLIRQGDLLKS
jgi:hypothetical protein